MSQRTTHAGAAAPPPGEDSAGRTPARQPVDQGIRTAATTDLDTCFFLEAGAGTGKTRILVDRVVEIIRRGAARIEQVVVITFTEKAAGELRARVRIACNLASRLPSPRSVRTIVPRPETS